MRNYRRQIISAVVILMALLAVGCRDTNYDLGSGFLSDSQVISIGTLDFKGYKEGSTDLDDRVMTTKLYRTNRIAASRQYYGVLGTQNSVTFGRRSAGFYSQYTPQYSLDYEGFGYEPVVDSVMIYLSVASYSGDTTIKQTYNVYEVVDDTFLTSSVDSIFGYDYQYPAGAISSTPVFSFDFPDSDNEVYLSSTYLKARIEAAGYDLLDRLTLKQGADGSQIDYSYYSASYDFSDFVGAFKGLYICPAEDPIAGVTTTDAGAVYTFDLASTGFGFFARNQQEDAPGIIADTIGMTYMFVDANSLEAGNISITHVDRDYSSSEIDMSTVTTNEVVNDAHTSVVRVEGLGGVVTEVTFERALFEELERVLAAANETIVAGTGEYTTPFFNVARMSVYTEGATEYDMPLVLSSGADADALSDMPSRLGMYVTYSSFLEDSNTSEMETVADYDYTYESAYSATSDYGGVFNRSQGSYEMNLPLQLQTMWTDYVEAKAAAGGDASAIDWVAQDWTKLYVAPIVDNLFSPRYVSLQGEADGVNLTPIRLEITYTLLKSGK